MPRLRNSFNWGSINSSNRASKSSFKSWLPKEDEPQKKTDDGQPAEVAFTGHSGPLSSQTQDNENDSDEIWSTLSALDDSIDSPPNIRAPSHRTHSLESLDVLDGGARFIAAVPLRKFSMSPGRNRDSYQVSRESLDSSILSAACTKSAGSLVTSFIDFRQDELILVKPIDGVIRYHLNSKRSKGTIGQLCLTTVRLKFITYQQANVGDESINSDHTLRLPPFDFHPFSEERNELLGEDINLINLYAVRVEQAQTSGISRHLLLTIYCNDFRCIEYQVKNNDSAKLLLDNLEKLLADPPLAASASNLPTAPPVTRISEKPRLWHHLSTEYSYRFPQDWMKLESHWLEGKASLRVSHCNDDFQLCNSLPPSFVTLRYHLTDAILVKKVSPQLSGQRVPVICYCCKMHDTSTKMQDVGFNMLLRSISLTDDVTNILYNSFSRLRIIDVNELLPSMVSVTAAYGKLRDASSLWNNGKRFFCQIGKWLKLVSKVLAVANDLAKVFESEASLLLMEESDRHWNPVLCSLIQLLMDPHRRTITGFESLLSKEWIYLCGISNKPNQVMFTLFLDCVWQLKTQNLREFEFTTLYLIRLFDLLYIPVTTCLQVQDGDEDHAESTHLKSTTNSDGRSLPLSLKQLSLEQLMFMYNPVYGSSGRKLKLSSDILTLEFWRPLYLRWHPLTKHIDYYNQFNPLEFIYFNSLLVSLFKYNVKTIVTSVEKETVL